MPTITEDLAHCLTGGLLDFCNKMAEVGITDLDFQESLSIGHIGVRRGQGSYSKETTGLVPSRHVLLAIIELALGRTAADDIARGSAEVKGSFGRYRIAASSMPEHGPITMAVRLQ